jgi:hypothetical protein
MKHVQLGEARNFYCTTKLFLGEAIANPLLADAPPMNTSIRLFKNYLRFSKCLMLT